MELNDNPGMKAAIEKIKMYIQRGKVVQKKGEDGFGHPGAGKPDSILILGAAPMFMWTQFQDHGSKLHPLH